MYALPAVGEKGYLDVEMTVETKGGHSSIPPKHSGIGLSALLIAALEANPPETPLSPDSPLVRFLECTAEYSPNIPQDLEATIRKLAKSGGVDKKAIRTLQDWFADGSWQDGTFKKDMGKALVSTTQAIDIINGGFKVNALVSNARGRL